jgi:hypothetical protein
MIALITHRLPVSAFDSPIVFFIAVRSWSPHRKTWIKIGGYKLTGEDNIRLSSRYASALHSPLRAGRTTYLSDYVIQFRDKWLLNDTESPVSTMLSMRLLRQKIARIKIQQDTIRWSDKQTISYGDIRISLQQVRELLYHKLRAAQKVFREALCFILEYAP